MILKSINPYTNLVIEEFEEFSDSKIERFLNMSDKAWKQWKSSGFNTRRSLIVKVSKILKANKTVYAAAITSEMGKPISESIAEIEKCAWVCEYYAENAEKFLRPETIQTDADSSFISYEPLGPVLGIMPWNFPFWQLFRFAVPTLMAGNTVLLKHASNVQICARHIEDIFNEAGFPASVFQNLVIGSHRMKNVIANNVIKAVSLTGSETAGRKVAEIAGGNIKKILLELGGSNAFVILKDADIQRAVETGLKARMQNAGQSCIAAKRFIVDRRVSRNFIEMFRQRIEELITGDPMNESTLMGPLSSIRQAETVESQVKKSVDMGAILITGGERTGAFYKPALVIGVKPGMPLFEEEVFGPVAPVIIADNTDEAINLANRTRYGLGVTIFTGDISKAEKMAPRFEDGAVFINSLVKSDPRLPFGGTKQSGYGRELSLHGIREFVNIKTIYIKE